MNYMGIDFHKHFTHFAILNQSGEVLKRARIPSEREAIIDFVEKVPKPVKAAIEATRNWYWAYDTIEPLVEELKLASPPKIRIIAESTVKTDKIDAKVIADLLRTNFLPVCYVPSQEVRQRRELLRHRTFLIRIRTKLKNRIHGILDKVGIHHPFENLFSLSGMKFLKSLELDWAYQQELDDYLETMEHLNGKVKAQNRIIEKLCKESPQSKLLMTIPGIGYHNALLIASEIGEVNRFSTGAKYAGYCGLVPTVHISEKTVRYGQMSRVGNRWLRWVYVEAAHIARRKSLRFSKLYKRVSLRKGPQVAIGAVARELAVVSFYVLKYQKAFKDYKW
jgi:transposase